MVRVDGDDNGGASLIRVRGLDKTYRRGSEVIHVLQGLNLDVDAGDFVAFMGPSGSGKTTLLNLLGGLDVPSAGSITVAGDEITHMSARKLTATWGLSSRCTTSSRSSAPLRTSSCRFS
jgi:putative ABC transport system ATP-binding protein